MGIPGLFPNWILSKVRDSVVRNLPRDKISSLSFDLNGLIYASREKAHKLGKRDYQTTIDIFLRKLTKIVKFISPKDYLIICIDGPAPFSKQQQQRSRRENSQGTNEITPGTDFMFKLDSAIKKFIKKKLYFFPKKIIYSSHLRQGEGEHKIKNYLDSLSGTVPNDSVHVLYGMDADLIMLSLLSKMKNIYLSRETLREFVEVEKIKDSIGRERIKELVLIMMLMGNDFVPQIQSLKINKDTIDFIINIVNENELVLINTDDSINWNAFKVLLGKLAIGSEQRLVELNFEFPNQLVSNSMDGCNFYYNNFRKNYYDTALGYKNKDLQHLLENFTGKKLGVSKSEVRTMKNKYVKIIAWTFSYYLGQNVNRDIYYPYHYAPLIKDFDSGFDIPDFYLNEGNEIEYNVYAQLMTVLPLKSKDLVPEEIQFLFSPDNILGDLYFKSFHVDTNGKKWEHTYISIIPFVDKSRVMEILETFDKNDNIPPKFQFKKDTIVKTNLSLLSAEQKLRALTDEYEILLITNYLDDEVKLFIKQAEEENLNFFHLHLKHAFDGAYDVVKRNNVARRRFPLVYYDTEYMNIKFFLNAYTRNKDHQVKIIEKRDCFFHNLMMENVITSIPFPETIEIKKNDRIVINFAGKSNLKFRVLSTKVYDSKENFIGGESLERTFPCSRCITDAVRSLDHAYKIKTEGIMAVRVKFIREV